MAETMWWWPSMENRNPRAKNALPSLPRDHKTIKGDLKREASAVALREILQKIMTTATTFIDLTKQTIKAQKMEAAAKLLSE
jgi:hypothetical protein